MSATDAYGEPIEPVKAPQLKEVDPVHGLDYVEGDYEPRCDNVVNGRVCNMKLAEFVTRPWRIKCRRCKSYRTKGTVPTVARDESR